MCTGLTMPQQIHKNSLMRYLTRNPTQQGRRPGATEDALCPEVQARPCRQVPAAQPVPGQPVCPCESTATRGRSSAMDQRDTREDRPTRKQRASLKDSLGPIWKVRDNLNIQIKIYLQFLTQSQLNNPLVRSVLHSQTRPNSIACFKYLDLEDRIS